jgi:hypothetical protein
MPRQMGQKRVHSRRASWARWTPYVSAELSVVEPDPVPKDSRVVGQTWAKANKDGSRDKRFADNYEIPIALYGSLVLKSDNGLWEEIPPIVAKHRH